MADLAVCIVPRVAVDVVLDAAGPASVVVGETVTIDVAVTNLGWRAAEQVWLAAVPTTHLSATSSGTPRALGTIAAGATEGLVLELVAVAPGVAKIVLEVGATNETPGHRGDEVVVEVHVADVTSPTTPSAPETPASPTTPTSPTTPVAEPISDVLSSALDAAGELATTGAGGTGWLVTVAIASLVAGIGLLRGGRVRSRP